MRAINTNAVITGIRSRVDRSLGLTVSTPELTTQEKALFMELQGISVQLLIEPTEDIAEKVEINKDVNQKSQSLRMRNVLFILWKQNNGGHEDFTSYYNAKMEKLINYLKDKIIDDYE